MTFSTIFINGIFNSQQDFNGFDQQQETDFANPLEPNQVDPMEVDHVDPLEVDQVNPNQDAVEDQPEQGPAVRYQLD